MTERIPESKKTLKELRARYGLSQTEVAEKLGISPPTYNKWEKNIGDVTVTNVIKVAELFNVTIDDIFLG